MKRFQIQFSRSFTVILLLLFFCGQQVLAQQNKKSETKKLTDTDKSSGGFLKNHTPRSKDFHAIGHSLFFDINLSPIQSYAPDTILDPFDSTTKYSRVAEYSFYNLSYFFRYNVYQPDDERAVTVTLTPSLGLGLSESKHVKGFGIVTGAALIGYEWGNGATYRSEREKGGFIRLGAEYNYTPLLVTSTRRPDKDIRGWIGPVISGGTRRINSKDQLVESNVKIGFGVNRITESDDGVNPYLFSRAFSLRYSIVIYLDH
jgi:hypothetical protein